MLLGPINTPSFYTYTMGAFKTEYDLSFVELMTRYATTNSLFGGKVAISEDIFYLEGVKVISGTKSIIDNVLIWSNNVEDILLYFQCMLGIPKISSHFLTRQM